MGRRKWNIKTVRERDTKTDSYSRSSLQKKNFVRLPPNQYSPKPASWEEREEGGAVFPTIGLTTAGDPGPKSIKLSSVTSFSTCQSVRWWWVPVSLWWVWVQITGTMEVLEERLKVQVHPPKPQFGDSTVGLLGEPLLPVPPQHYLKEECWSTGHWWDTLRVLAEGFSATLSWDMQRVLPQPPNKTCSLITQIF